MGQQVSSSSSSSSSAAAAGTGTDDDASPAPASNQGGAAGGVDEGTPGGPSGSPDGGDAAVEADDGDEKGEDDDDEGGGGGATTTTSTRQDAGAASGATTEAATATSPVKKMEKIKGIEDGWFSEVEAMWPGQKFSLALEGFSQEGAVLHNQRSDHQSILVFRSAQYGNVMALDGVIQLTERDEFAFHETMAHVPLFAHPHPRNVLIVGGGDGGLLREVCRHECVESVTLVEIDPAVIEVGKRFFAESTATAFDDPRLTVVHEDAAEFLRKLQERNTAGGRSGGGDDGDADADAGEGNSEAPTPTTTTTKYDVIFSDSSDPSGPAETLFQPTFYEQMFEMLNEDGGIICAQCECVWIHLDLIADVVACCSDIGRDGDDDDDDGGDDGGGFDTVEYATTMVPTYPCGQIGFLLASRGRTVGCRVPSRTPSEEFQSRLRWYNPDMHGAAFVLPQFVEEKLAPLRREPPTPTTPDDGGDDGEDDDPGRGDGGEDCFLGNLRCVVS